MSAFHLIRAVVFTLGAIVAFGPLPAAAQADKLFPAANNTEDADGAQFENAYFRIASDADAARFLNQATFGATRAEITQVRSLGPEPWMEAQFNQQQTLARPFLETVAQQRHVANQTLSQDDRLHRWFDTAGRSPDQLRQKMAYVLGQIIVTSDRNDFLGNEPLQMAEWNDIMVRNAFGNYQNLLREVSFSPMMGRYLTTMRNRKYELNSTFTSTGTAGNLQYTINTYSAGNSGNEPDENYAREVMQLFSVGLVTRDRNFTPVDTDPITPGVQELATYDQQMIRTLTRAFTGLSYDCTGNANVQGVAINRNCGTGCFGLQCRFTNRDALFFNDPPRARLPNDSGDSSLIHPDWFRPMVCYPRYNDSGRDQSRFQLPGQSAANPTNTTISPAAAAAIPAGVQDKDKVLALSGVDLLTLQEFSPGVSKETVKDCSTTVLGNLTDAERQQCVDYCEGNIRSAVDLLFNHPNTATMVARQLILHLTDANPSPEYIDRVAAKFEDNGAGVRGDLKATLKAVLLDVESRRPFGADPNFGKPREPLMKLVQTWRNFGAVPADGRRWGMIAPQDTFFQRPLGAPSVFNFYEPDYSQPGPIADAGLYSPEFQIINENAVMQTANTLYNRLCTAYGGGNNNCNGAFVQPGTTGTNSDRAYIPASVIDALPGMACATDVVNGCTGVNDLQLIEELNLRMMGGTMTGQVGNPLQCSDPTNFGMKSTLHNLLNCGLTGTLGQTGATANVEARRRKAMYLIHLIAISPEFAHQR